MKNLLVLFFLFTTVSIFSQTNYEEINFQITQGNFSKAAGMIKEKISIGNLSPEEIYDLNFQIDKLARIRTDFTKTKSDVKSSLIKYFPDLADAMLDSWERNKKLETKIIDGEKKYFKNAAANLFRVDKEAKRQKEKIDGRSIDKLAEFLKIHIPAVVDEAVRDDSRYVSPVKMRIRYTVSVDENAVPDGEVIRCWLPYPREDEKRQRGIKLISVSEDEFIISDNKNSQRTIYLEQKAKKDLPAQFQYELEYESFAEFNRIEMEKVKPYDKTSDLYKFYTSERPPHIIFTDEVKTLSKKIVGEENNPFLTVKKIYSWIEANIPWASALEYSTIDNISAYCIDKMYGDCGIKTFLFMTLARFNGTPAKWQSGWMMHPGKVNLHDWCEVYFEGYGWVPVDQDFGIIESENTDIKYFYIGGIDSYRLIVNNDYSQPLFPAKIYPRSETNDFQRGELEWRGGNLYFDKWNYDMEVTYLNEDEK